VPSAINAGFILYTQQCMAVATAYTAGDLLADVGQIWGETTRKEKKSLLLLMIQQKQSV